MSLRSRLEQLERTGCLDFAPPPPRISRELESILGGTVASNGCGSFFLCRRELDEGGRHGPLPFAHARRLPLELLTTLSAGTRGLDPERLLFLDTETTGLSGGTGTYAFLVGLAWFEQGQLCVEQLLMREHVEEKALLEHLRERLSHCGGLVTYNGKTFDAQLLQTRFMMNRMRVDLEDLPHLDLLHLCRRVWGAGLSDCRLETLETEVLGRPRNDDTPGWLVPQIYFRFLRNGDASGLKGIAEHNHRDLLAMVGLVGLLGELLTEPLACRSALERYALGRLFDDLGQTELALALLERAVLEPLPAERRKDALLRLARLKRRAGDRRSAVELWKGVLREHPQDPDACEELAKYLEHQVGDYALALKLVERVLRSTRLTPSRRRSFLHRRTRLVRRMVPDQLPG